MDIKEPWREYIIISIGNGVERDASHALRKNNAQ